MTGYFELVLAAEQKKKANSPERASAQRWIAVLEVCVITFMVVMIPDLILLGRPPENLTEVWKPFLSALLASIYAYVRVKAIEIKNE